MLPKTQNPKTMKTSLRLFVLLSLILMLGTTVQAQITETATATATIVQPITLLKVVDMDFGNLAVTTTAGTEVLDPASTPSRTVTGGVTLPAVTGTVAAAEFDVTGVPNYTYAITLPASVVITNGTGSPPATMTVDTFISDQPGNIGTLDGSGQQTFYVGATCNVAALQDAGTYTSLTPFDVTVNYN
jgi:hypothetical protein